MKQKIILLVLSLSITFTIGFLPSQKYLQAMFINSAYYFALFSFLLWVYLICQKYHKRPLAFFKTHYIALVTSLILMTLIFASTPKRFKLLYDETNLIGTSLSMYQRKTVDVPVEGLNIDYNEPDYKTQVDKRPVLFSFFISLVHDLLGFSPYNGFIVNFILGVLTLFSFYLLISKWFSAFWGVIAQICLASLPIFAFCVTSSGFEVCNLFFIIYAFLIFNNFLAENDTKSLEIVLATLILLAQCRYESIVFIPIFVFLLLCLKRQKIIEYVTPQTFWYPILLLPVFWQPRLWVNAPIMDKIDYQMVKSADLMTTFSLHHFIKHLPHNLYVMLGFDPHYGFSPIISLLGIFGFYLIIKQIYNHLICAKLSQSTSVIFGILTFTCIFLIIGSYYQGDFTDPSANRLILFSIPYIVVAFIFFAYYFLEPLNTAKKTLVLIFIVYHLLHFSVYGKNQMIMNRLSLPYEYQKTVAFIKSSFPSNSKLLLVSNAPHIYVIFRYGSLSYNSFANASPETIDYYSKEFDHVLFIKKHYFQKPDNTETNLVIGRFNTKQIKALNICDTYRIDILEWISGNQK